MNRLAAHVVRVALPWTVLLLGACAEVKHTAAELDAWAKRNMAELGGTTYGGSASAPSPTQPAAVASGGETGPVARYRKGDAAPAADKLRTAMAAGGLTVYSGEWWHFDGPGADVARPIVNAPLD